MPKIAVNGLELVYEETGQGEPLVFIHGLGSSHAMFEAEAEHFQNGFRVIRYDARGHGQSGKPGKYTLNDHIEDLRALLDYLQIDQAHILGVSMGSYIAQGFVLAHPERVEKLILVVSKSNGKTSSTQELIERYQEEIDGMDELETMAHLSQYMFHNLKAVGRWQADLAKLEKPLTLTQQAAANKALEGFDFRASLPSITADTLIISGTHDGLNPPERGREIASFIPGSRFVEFEKSGHAPNVEEPEKFLQVIGEFLEA
ncbi:Putative non-heme bromoperoxidase BpoC [Planococcus massiliensis]|uniref:Putative non-heme bromoperoxidase BpoC n=1 Tax=Planococcus massiliensis TaxID=1499687 RepID=A0A098EQ45_9BACL|nr:alpha/beta fold hydrolase [Planococcus massiliensis]CEG23892.1 Putative non-heme bromoperoxidase BpoC [Planococcus massiliensis]